MRLPQIQMSNGAWIFASAVAVAIIASGGAYAVSNTIFAIGNANGTTTAYVTPTRQLQTTTIAPINVLQTGKVINATATCVEVYTPPPGKALVVTHATYDLNSGTEGKESFAALARSSTCGSYPADYGDTNHAFESQSHAFPTGLPMQAAYASVGGYGYVIVLISGYLIPASQLPPEAPQPRRPVKGMLGSE